MHYLTDKLEKLKVADYGQRITVYMLRHAESEYNAGDVTKPDAKLTKKGQVR